MKLTSLINETSDEHRRELSEGKFLETLREKAKNSHVVAQQAPFFRQDSGPEMMLVTPSHREERSSFWVDKFIKEIPAWGKFPSRARFIKGYTQFDRTFGGDDVYVIIPLDSSRVGICPGPSFYRSFTDFEKSLGFDRVDNQTLIDWVTELQSALAQLTDVKVKKFEPTTFSQFKKALAQLDEIIGDKRELLKRQLSESDALSDAQAKFLKDLLSRHVTTAERYLEEKLDPDVNGFSAVRIESFSKTAGDHEIWIDSPSLLVKRTKYIEMHKRGAL